MISTRRKWHFLATSLDVVGRHRGIFAQCMRLRRLNDPILFLLREPMLTGVLHDDRWSRQMSITPILTL
jgi:hypothetical protein